MSDEPTTPASEATEPAPEGAAASGGTPRIEEFKVTGDALVGRLKELLHEGNIRRITIKNEEGNTLIEVPLTLGVVGVLLLPVWAAIGAIAALAARLTIVIEKVE